MHNRTHINTPGPHTHKPVTDYPTVDCPNSIPSIILLLLILYHEERKTLSVWTVLVHFFFPLFCFACLYFFDNWKKYHYYYPSVGPCDIFMLFTISQAPGPGILQETEDIPGQRCIHACTVCVHLGPCLEVQCICKLPHTLTYPHTQTHTQPPTPPHTNK